MKSFVLILFVSLVVQALPSAPPLPLAEVCINPEEKKLYDLIMEYRKSKGLPAIPLSAKLTLVAQTHARDLAENYRLDRSGKCNLHSWSKKGNWSPCCYTSDHKRAECMWNKPQEIAAYESAGYEIAFYSSSGATAEEGLNEWKKSPGHNPVIINEGTWKKVQWQAIGLAIYEGYGLVWFGEKTDTTPIQPCL